MKLRTFLHLLQLCKAQTRRLLFAWESIKVPTVKDTSETRYHSQDCSLEEIKKLCWEQLEPISEKNLTEILAGKNEGQFGFFFTIRVP